MTKAPIRSFGNHPEKSLNLVLIRRKFGSLQELENILTKSLAKREFVNQEPHIFLTSETPISGTRIGNVPVIGKFIPSATVAAADVSQFIERIRNQINQQNPKAAIAVSLLVKGQNDAILNKGYLIWAEGYSEYPKVELTRSDLLAFFRDRLGKYNDTLPELFRAVKRNAIYWRKATTDQSAGLEFPTITTKDHQIEVRVCADSLGNSSPSKDNRQVLLTLVPANNLVLGGLTQLAQNRHAVIINDSSGRGRVMIANGGKTRIYMDRFGAGKKMDKNVDMLRILRLRLHLLG